MGARRTNSSPSTKVQSGAGAGKGKGGAKQINKTSKATAASGKGSTVPPRPPRQSGRTGR